MYAGAVHECAVQEARLIKEHGALEAKNKPGPEGEPGQMFAWLLMPALIANLLMPDLMANSVMHSEQPCADMVPRLPDLCKRLGIFHHSHLGGKL